MDADTLRHLGDGSARIEDEANGLILVLPGEVSACRHAIPSAGNQRQSTTECLQDPGFTPHIAVKGQPAPIQAGHRWPVERTHSWMNGYGKLRRFTDKRKVIEFYLRIAAALTVIR